MLPQAVCRGALPMLRQHGFYGAWLDCSPPGRRPAGESVRFRGQNQRDCDRIAAQSASSPPGLWPYISLASASRQIEAMTTVAQADSKLVDRIEEVGAKIGRVRETTGSTIFGQERVIDLALITLLSGGHALLIGVPGLAKTSLVETLGTVLGLQNKRIQFTPDLMPSDIVGSEVLEEGAGGRR